MSITFLTSEKTTLFDVFFGCDRGCNKKKLIVIVDANVVVNQGR